MALSHMQVFNDFIMPATIEQLGQMIDKFNAASNNTITLSADGFSGDFMQNSFFAAIHSAQRRVDRYSANGTPAVTNLTEVKDSQIKIAGGFGPIEYEPGQMTWLQRLSPEGLEVSSRNFAEALLADQLNTSIAALVAAISNQADATHDGSGGALTYVGVNKSHSKFGDRSASLVASVMNGTAFHQFIENNLNNAERLFASNGVTVVDILGRAIVVTDAPALVEAGTTDKYKVLSLTQGAARVSNTSDVITNVETNNGKDRIVTSFQADYTFGLGLKGYTWDETNGGKSPSDAAIATGSNWDKTASDIKHTAGVVAIADVS